MRLFKAFVQPPWLDDGMNPDYRFTLANERTFLAWIRTALALLAAAVAMVQFLPSFRLPGAHTAITLILTVDGLLVTGLAYKRWAGNERAMRHDQRLPHSPMLALLALSLAIVAVIVLAVILAGGT